MELELLEEELLEVELELLALELDELELPSPLELPLPLEPVLPPHAAKAASNTREILALVKPTKPTDGYLRFIKHIPMLCDLPFEATTAAKFTPAKVASQMRCCYP